MSFNAIHGLTKDSKTTLDRKQETAQHVDDWGAEDSPPIQGKPQMKENTARGEIHTAEWTKEERGLCPQAPDGHDFPEITPPNMQNALFCKIVFALLKTTATIFLIK